VVFPYVQPEAIACASKRRRRMGDSSTARSCTHRDRSSCDLRGYITLSLRSPQTMAIRMSKFHSIHPSKLACTFFLKGGLGCFQLRASTSTAYLIIRLVWCARWASKGSCLGYPFTILRSQGTREPCGLPRWSRGTIWAIILLTLVCPPSASTRDQRAQHKAFS
jgi:hypothetical protein